MGEYIGVTVTAGGSVTRKTWREFMRDMQETGFRFQIINAQLYFADEANYGNTDDVQQVCRDHGIAYKASNDAKYEINGGAEVWFPDLDGVMTATADQDGQPMLTIADLKKALDAGKSIGVLIAEHEPFLRDVPPMLIDGKPVTDADLEDRADYDGDEEPDADAAEPEPAQSADQVLYTIRQQVALGMGSKDPIHWEAALSDINQTLINAFGPES